MFLIDGQLKIITIDQCYMKALYDVCDQVFYLPMSYSNKPYVGLLLNNNGQDYAIPLTSAKEKHKTWKNYQNGRFLIFENCNNFQLTANNIWIPNADGSVKRILAALIVSKMIPVKKGIYRVVDFRINPLDTMEQVKYKNLLKKEYAFCVSIKEKIIKEASKIYDRQMKTGKVYSGYCNFLALEKVCNDFPAF